jgi:membrane protease subunit HflC
MVAALVVVIIVFMMCAFQVRFTETAVVTRFDEIVKTVEPQQAGLHFKMPWPVDRIHRYDTRLRSFETDFRQLGTEDQKTIVLTAYATWRIADGKQFLKAVSKEDAAAAKIRDLLENRVSIVLRTHPLSHLVNVDPNEMKFAQIEKEFLAGIRDQAMNNYGIDIVTVGIKRLGIPESVTQEVFSRMKEDRQKTIKELTAEGLAEGQKIRVSAEEIANKILARAAAYAKQIEAEGDAIAAGYNSEFMKDQKLSNLLKTKETLLKVLEGGQSTLVLDANKFEFLELLRDAAPSPKAGPRSQDDVAQKDTPKTAKAEPANERPPSAGEGSLP